LTGEVDVATRSKIVADFSADPSVRFLLATIGVGSEGLTLTAANHVIFLNLWWNPSSNNQARDRVIRIGQTKDVYVRILVSANTVEEQLLQLLRRKQLLFDALVRPVPPRVRADLARTLAVTGSARPAH
jgi:SNF2 family DNA or RNA helicase